MSSKPLGGDDVGRAREILVCGNDEIVDLGTVKAYLLFCKH